MSEDQTEEQVELTIDDLFRLQVDNDAAKEAEKELLLKAGTWTTIPPWKVTVTKNAKDKDRLMVFVFGKVSLAGEKDGAIGYRFSPERRNAVDFATKVPTDKPDRAYKNYLMVRKAYATAYGREPESLGEIVAYLRDFEHRVRIMQTEGAENMVVAVTAVPPKQADA